jgi:hypothetical protein
MKAATVLLSLFLAGCGTPKLIADPALSRPRCSPPADIMATPEKPALIQPNDLMVAVTAADSVLILDLRRRLVALQAWVSQNCQ